MEKEKYIPKESKNIIRPRIKIKMNKLKENSISKSNTNYKTNRGLHSENNQKLRNKEKLLDANTTNEDKDLESLLSELKTTLLAKSKLNNKENTDLEDLNNFEDNNFYLLYKKGDYIVPQKKKDNENDFIDLNLSLEEQEGGNEISQRVHTRKAKNHYKMKTNKNNKDNKNVKSYRALPPIYTSELIKNIKKLGNLKSNTKQNISNCKNKKTINMLKNKTSINSIPILDKYILISKKIKKKSVDKKAQPIKINKKFNKYENNQRKTHKNLLCNKSKIPYKNEIRIPVTLKLNKTANLESPEGNNNKKIKVIINHNSSSIFKNNSNNNSRTKIKSLNYNNSYNRIGDLYINKRCKKNDKNKNKIRLFDCKKYYNNNPFEEFDSILSKSPSFRINNTYGEMKKSIDNHYINKNPKFAYQINLKYKRKINVAEKNKSAFKKNVGSQYNNLKEYYSNIYYKREKYKINKNNTNFIFENSKKNEDKFKNIFSINNTSQFKNYNSVKNIEISI